jgi:K+-sensing histidine kinase KdpD
MNGYITLGQIMAALLDIIEKQPKWVVNVIGLILIVLIGLIDYLTGDYSILVFYLLPVFLVSWFSGRWPGVASAIISGCARFLSDFAVANNSHLLYWNSFEDMIFLLIVAVLVAILRKTLQGKTV